MNATLIKHEKIISVMATSLANYKAFENAGNHVEMNKAKKIYSEAATMYVKTVSEDLGIKAVEALA